MTDAGRMRVLLATDDEDPALQAEKLLTEVADRRAVTVLAACVSTFDMALQVSEDLRLGRYSPEAGLRHAGTVAEQARARLHSAAFDASSYALEGDTPTELLALAGHEAVELIVLGAGHARWREMPVLGRTTRIVLHESPCSVLLVHRWRPDRGHAHVLVGTDGSAEAQHAIEVFASFADPARCRVLVASATRGRAAAAPQSGEPPPEAAVSAPAAEAAVNAAVSALEDRGFTCRSEVVEGHPVRALLELAEREQSSMVVVGSRGLGRWKRLALGSVTDALARHADAAFVGRGAPQERA